jgi:hypothetical protein
MTSRIHSILPRIALAATIPVVALLVWAFLWYKRPYVVPSGLDIFAVVEGRWAWSGDAGRCTTDWHRISFSPDHRVMTITSSAPYKGADGKFDSVAVYDIQAHTGSWIRGAIRGERRLTADRQPVVWDLVLRSHDRYAWHRTDWLPGGFTRAIERCDSL